MTDFLKEGMQDHIDGQIKKQVDSHETTNNVRKLEDILGTLDTNPRINKIYTSEQVDEMKSSIKDRIKNRKS